MIEFKYNTGDKIYLVNDNEIQDYKISRIMLEDNESGGMNISYSATLIKDPRCIITFSQDACEYEIYKYREEAEESLKTGKVGMSLYILIGTDGYNENTIKYTLIPKRFISSSGGAYNSARLTETGVEWFKENVYEGFDNGGYYRIYPVTEKDIEKLVKKKTEIEEVLKLWEDERRS